MMTIFAQLRENVEDLIVQVYYSNKLSDNKYDGYAERYRQAVDIISGLERMGTQFTLKTLDDLFRTCPVEFAFVYDHLRECLERGYVIPFTAYDTFAARFPRSR